MFMKSIKNTVPSSKASALDVLVTNVMIADESLNIIYMNPAVIALLQEYEDDLKKELPRFSVNTLIGSNIDVFHKTPSHQRNLLAHLKNTHKATISVGKLTFDLVITPMIADSKTTGFVVEWSNAKDRLANVDYANKMVAINRTQAMIEFTPEGIVLDANDIFLKTLGYSIEEIRGQHHKMFCEASFVNSPDYQKLWDSLRGGNFISAQFKRLAKGGRPVFIEGAYSPITDAKGKVVKVVKFASDVTAQVGLLADLKVLIDQNFAEIDQSIGRSKHQSLTVAESSNTTLQTVQVVAASAHQMSASVDEISNSMVQSRAASDKAYDQAVEVGHSTEKLAQSANEMNGIVDLIRNIAGQINLLALNATIEAARAGDAGKGFAVVANEVKNLANQSAKATEQISREIDGLQKTAKEVAAALDTILVAISQVKDHVTGTASAVEEQAAVTRSMSENMNSAAGLVSSVTSSVEDIAHAVEQVAQAVNKTKQAAEVLVR